MARVSKLVMELFQFAKTSWHPAKENTFFDSIIFFLSLMEPEGELFLQLFPVWK